MLTIQKGGGVPIPDGTLNLDHLRQLKDAVVKLEADEKELFELGSSIPHEVYDLLLAEDFSWSEYYELTPMQHGILLFWSFGMSELLNDLVKQTGNANQAMFELIKRFPEFLNDIVSNWFGGQTVPSSLDECKDLRGGPGGIVRAQDVAGLIYAMVGQVSALREHGKYMSELVADVSKGKDESFSLAVKIDPTVFACPAFVRRMSIAYMRQDQEFFLNLSNSLKAGGRKSKKELDPLRVILQACLEGGWLETLTMEEADRVFIQELNAYSNDGEDPARSLQKFINRWKNNK